MGYRLVVTGLEAKYYNSATYDDLITVRTRISELAITRAHIPLHDLPGQNTHRRRNNKTSLHHKDKKPVVIPHIFSISLRDATAE